MLALPRTDWRSTPFTDQEVDVPIAAAWPSAASIEHVFTHFSLTLSVWRAQGELPGAIWTPLSGLGALPSLFLKAAKAGLA